MPRGQITAPAGKVGTSCPHVSRRPCRAVEPRLPLLVYVSDCALQNSKSEFLRQWRRLPKDFRHMGQLTSRQETVGIRTESSSSARPLHAPSNYLHTLRERRGHMVAATSGGRLGTAKKRPWRSHGGYWAQGTPATCETFTQRALQKAPRNLHRPPQALEPRCGLKAKSSSEESKKSALRCGLSEETKEALRASVSQL